MGISVLKFAGHNSKPSELILNSESNDSFADLKSSGEFGAYVVRTRDLETLLKFAGVIDVGSKRGEKELGRVMLGKENDGMPLIRGGYTKAGRLEQGVKSLLERASRESNIYIIGADDAIFEALAAKAAAPERQNVRRIETNSSSGTVITRIMGDLLHSVEVPRDLVDTYVGTSAEAHLVRQLIVLAAKSDVPVLIIGDTGTGKEIVASEIHHYSLKYNSVRRTKEFSPVNCAAIPGELLESVLFGNPKYVYTDARADRKGIWEETGRGTLFLDEIGELRHDHQAKILRVLAENTIRRIGEGVERRVEARVITATNRDLFAMVHAEQFRADLYHRLSSFVIPTPALRNHPEDIPVIAQHLWQSKITGDQRRPLSDVVLSELQSYRWPGNVRELKAVLLKMSSLFGSENLGVVHVRAALQFQGQTVLGGAGAGSEPDSGLYWVERLRHIQRIDEALRACNIVVRTIVDGRKTSTDEIHYFCVSFHYRVKELESLLEKKSLLSQSTFSTLYGLRGRLFDFEGRLHSDVKSAVRFWKSEVAKEIQRAQSALFQEGERLLRNA